MHRSFVVWQQLLCKAATLLHCGENCSTLVSWVRPVSAVHSNQFADLSGFGQGQAVGCCEHGNEPQGSIKCG
jgi:hypothetical protein